ncbi:MAG: hypothetical protein ACRC1M_06930 [Methanobacteriaceae archaeon]
MENNVHNEIGKNLKFDEEDKILLILKEESELCNNPDFYDGSYELVKKTVEFLSNLNSSDYDISDMDMLYLMTVGTWKHGWDSKEKKSIIVI